MNIFHNLQTNPIGERNITTLYLKIKMKNKQIFCMENIKEKSQIIFQSELFLNYTEENTCIIIWFIEKKMHKTTYISYSIQLMKIVHVRNNGKCIL